MKHVNLIADKIFRFLIETRNYRRTMTSLSSGERYKSVARERVDAVVIGAGVVGIAVARELAVKHGRDVLVIDSAPTFGTGTSSRNSEVIHAGIYYPPNSLKVHFLLFLLLPFFLCLVLLYTCYDTICKNVRH